MSKVTYSGNAKKPTSKKVLNKIMPIKAIDGATMFPEDPNNPYRNAWSSTGGLSPQDTAMGQSAAGTMPQQGGYAATQPAVYDNTQQLQAPQNTKKSFLEQHPINIAAKLSTNDLVAGTIATANSIIPEEIKRDNQNRTQMMYNPRPYGDGTQAISKYGNTFENGGSIPVSPQERDAWERMQSQAYQQGFMGNNHNQQVGMDYAQQHGFDPSRIAAIQQDFQQIDPSRIATSTGDLSKVDNFYGTKTAQQRYKHYSLQHNNETPVEFGTDRDALAAAQSKLYEPIISSAPIQQTPVPVAQIPTPKPLGLNSNGFPTREEAIQKYKAKKQKDNWHTNEEASYDMHSSEGKNGMTMKKGGKKCAEGGEFIDFPDYDEAALGIQMLGKGSIKPMGANMYSEPMHWAQGPSHDENGIPIEVNGQRAEIQGGEGVYSEQNGNTTIFGGMKMPKLGPETKGLAGRTFQSIAKEIGKQEEKNEKMNVISDTILENNSPSNKFDSLKIGSAMAMQSAFKMRSATATAAKENLASVQKMMHEDADKNGIDYGKAHTIYAKKGATIKKDTSNFRFDEDPTQSTTDPTYPFVNRFPQKIDAMQIPNVGPNTLPVQQRMQPTEIPDTLNPYMGVDKSYRKATSMADQNPLRVTDFLGEIGYMAKQPAQVLSQEYKPYLDTPYQVSFQDRRNQNQSTFNEISKQLQGTGTAASLAALAGQKYEADNQVNAEEFRTNQGIASSVSNQNYNLLNDAAKTNMGLKDQQFVRQSQAKSNTDAQRAQALASISNKIAANRYENMNLRMVEEHSGYRWNPDTKKMEWIGGPATFNPYGSGQAVASQNRVTTHKDSEGNITGYDEINYSEDEDAVRRAKALKAQRSVYSKFGNVFKS